MGERTQVKLDDFGRLVIPKSIRKKFMLKENEFLLLESDEEKIILKKKVVSLKYKRLIKKLEFLSDKYNLSLVMIDNNEVIYTTFKFDYLLNKKIDKKVFDCEGFNCSDNTKITKNDVLNINHYYFPIYVDSYTKCLLFVVGDKDMFDLAF